MSHRLPNPILSERFDRALLYASEKHRRQARKETDIPYIAHLLAVTAIVIEAGADEDTAIGALLHDVVEDQGGTALLPEIEQQFGTKVRKIVEACSDSTTGKNERKPDWQSRKQTYLSELPRHSEEARLVSLADKLHNARSIVRDLRREGVKTFERFQGKRSGTLWYYSQLRQIFQNEKHQALGEEFSAVVAEMISLSESTTKDANG